MLCFYTSGDFLNEKEHDALQKLLQNKSFKLPPGQLTFEKVQQLLHKNGLAELATNLRAKLSEGKTIL